MATLSEFNAQGRSVSDSMRLRAFEKWLATQKPKAKFETETYRGFEISGQRSKWYVRESGSRLWPRDFRSRDQARQAVDTCLAIRQEVSHA